MDARDHAQTLPVKALARIRQPVDAGHGSRDGSLDRRLGSGCPWSEVETERAAPFASGGDGNDAALVLELVSVHHRVGSCLNQDAQHSDRLRA